MKYKALIFDLDGTLLDSLPDIAKAMNIMLERMGYPTHNTEQYKYLVGEGIKELVKHAIPGNRLNDYIDENGNENGIDSLVLEYRKIYDTQWRIQTRPYNGIPEMLDELTRRKIKMGILSNKLDDFVKRMVTELLPTWKFDAVFGTRPGIPLKPNPTTPLEMARIMDTDPSEMIFVGDSGIDMQTAVHSKMLPIGVLWGLRDEQELKTNGAAALIEHPLDLFEILS
jgi:phosphoglycolate phosphatase